MVDAVPLTQDQILAQLQVRGFESGFQRTPLRDFWGRLTSITGEMRQGQSGPFAVALYNFDEVEAIESIEVYTSPIGQIEVPVSTRDKSKMGYLGTSIDNIINAGLPLDAPPEQVKNQDYLVTKMLHMKLMPGRLIPSRDDATGAWSDKPTECWELIEMKEEGVPAVATPTPGTAATPTQPVAAPTVDANTQALKLLDGKNENQWHQDVFNDPVVKTDTAVVQTIINGSFLSGLVAAKKVTKGDDGIYHVT